MKSLHSVDGVNYSLDFFFFNREYVHESHFLRVLSPAGAANEAKEGEAGGPADAATGGLGPGAHRTQAAPDGRQLQGPGAPEGDGAARQPALPRQRVVRGRPREEIDGGREAEVDGQDTRGEGSHSMHS